MKLLSVAARVLSAAIFVAGGVSQAATINVAGFTFDTTAFATATTLVSGGPASFNFPTTGSVNSDILKAVDSDLTSYLFSTPITFNATFGNGGIVNLAGADFVVFEVGTPDSFFATINGSTQSFLTVATGFTAGGFAVNAAAVDLSSFGVANNALVSSVVINNASSASTISSAIAAIGSLNIRSATAPVPEPSAFLSICGGLGLLGYLRKRKGL